MTKSRILAVVAGSVAVVSMALSHAVAQTAAPRGGVALINISYILKNHTHFKSMMSGMQADAERAEAGLKAQQEEIRKLNEQLKDFKAGTPQYKQLEEAIVRRTVDLNAQLQLTKKELLQNESQIYHTIYKEIQQQVDYYARTNGIIAVLQFNGEESDPLQPQSVLQEINNPMVWHDSRVDITGVIFEALQARRAPAAANTTSRTGVPSQQGVPYQR